MSGHLFFSILERSPVIKKIDDRLSYYYFFTIWSSSRIAVAVVSWHQDVSRCIFCPIISRSQFIKKLRYSLTACLNQISHFAWITQIDLIAHIAWITRITRVAFTSHINRSHRLDFSHHSHCFHRSHQSDCSHCLYQSLCFYCSHHSVRFV